VPVKYSEKKWKIHPPLREIQELLSSHLGISPLLSQLLASRNITTPEDVEGFLSPSLSNLHSPFLMKDMEKAVERIGKALREGEKIVLYGDYDVDGITGTSLLLLFLKNLGAKVSFFIPERLTHGYGLNLEVLKGMKEEGAQLIITIDCGSSDVEEVQYAQQQGIDVIITDHHEIPHQVPPAYAIVNPKQRDCGFPFDSLAGVGVVFNLLMALRKTLRDGGFWSGQTEPNLKEYLDLVTLGTIADVVPLVDENRILVKAGLAQLNGGNRTGISALKEVCGLTDTPITTNLIAFRLAPRLNAPGRLSQASQSVMLLTSDDYQEAKRIALHLEHENSQRQLLEMRIFKEACTLIEATPQLGEGKSIVLASSEWHPGVIGICASRLLDLYGKPAVLISCDEKRGMGRGSARSHESFHLFEGLKECEHLLEGYGGHHSAAGLTIALDKIEEFQVCFDSVVSERMSEEEYSPSLEIDAEVTLGEISEQLLKEIAMLEPFGLCNPEPTFSSFLLDSYSTMVVGNGHLKLKVKEENMWYDAIGFNMAEQFLPSSQTPSTSLLNGTNRIKIAFIPQFNTWQGVKSIQLKVKDIKCIDGT
jgi:single-stranded-DNA-specific exonuclease